MADRKLNWDQQQQEAEIRDFVRDPARLQQRAMREFAKAMRTGRLIAFTGSYATEGQGYGKWMPLLQLGLPTLADVKAKVAGDPPEWVVRAYERLRQASPDANTLIDYELLHAYVAALGLETDKKFAKQVENFLFKQARTGETTTDAIVRFLGIRRIVTLNYDFEAEFSLMADAEMRLNAQTEPVFAWKKIKARSHKASDDAAFPAIAREKDPSERWYLVGPDGTRVVSDSFDRERTDRLFEFAIQSSQFDGHVLHLHGNAESPGSMVLRFRDYEDRYRRSNLTKLPFEHAMRCLFGGNPVVFIGTGQSEEEILQHLRQFVADGLETRSAPVFAIWSPKDETGAGAIRFKGKVSADDNLRRLRWFRQFGIFAIYDSELTEFDPGKDKANGQLQRSIRLLARETGTLLKPHEWEHHQFRRIDHALKVNGRPGIPPAGAHIWRTHPGSDGDVWLPTWQLPDDSTPSPHATDPAEYLHQLIDFGAPIKAMVDEPGSGHGYLARLLQDLVTGRQARWEADNPKETAPCLYVQINAGFSWEFDTAFELITGLYDGEFAFGENEGDQTNRDAQLRRYLRKLENCVGIVSDKIQHFLNLRAKSRGGTWAAKADLIATIRKPFERQLVICFNGAERYFDPTGYPLSSDLDRMIRLMRKVGENVSAFNKALETAGISERLRNPITLFLFGTGRVARYLENLGFREDGTAEFLGSLQSPFHGERGRHRIPAGSSGNAYSDMRLLEFLNGACDDAMQPGGAIASGSKQEPPIRLQCLPESPKNERGNADATSRRIRRYGDRFFRSGYLRLAEERLRARLDSKLGDGNTEFQMPGAHREALARTRGRGPREQRESFVDAWLNTEILARMFGNARGEMTAASVRKAKLVLAVLRTMAFVGQPVEPATLAECPDVKALASVSDVTRLLRNLAKLNLVVHMARFPGDDSADPAYDPGERHGLHRALLHEIRDRHTLPISDARTYTSFNVPLFAAQPIDDSEPKPEVHVQLHSLVEALIDDPDDRDSPTDGIGSYRYGSRLRASVASLRSYFTTSALLMHEPDPAPSERKEPRLTEHARLIERLIRRFEENAGKRKELDETDAILKAKPKSAFPHDLIWLHDQRGVALLAQGSLYAARQAFGEAQRINDKFTEPGVFGQTQHHGNYWRHITLNQLHLDIERARIREAEAKLFELEQSVNAMAEENEWRSLYGKWRGETFGPMTGGLTPFEVIVRDYGGEPHDRQRVADPVFPADAILTAGLLCLYRGWHDLLSGRKRKAGQSLGTAINILHNLSEGRALAIALRHYASVLRSIGDIDGARDAIRRCLTVAVSNRQMDLAHHAWISRAELDLDANPQANGAEALQQFNESLRYATLTEMYRVQMEARRALAKLKLAGGDYDGAFEHASEALTIAIRRGFGLRKISLRVQIGEILYRRGDRLSGVSMLDQALDEGDRQGYQTAVEQVHITRKALGI